MVGVFYEGAGGITRDSREESEVVTQVRGEIDSSTERGVQTGRNSCRYVHTDASYMRRCQSGLRARQTCGRAPALSGIRVDAMEQFVVI